jgi:hypothetical protein
MRLVIGAFTTLSEAENATRALLEAGHEHEALSAYGRVGGGKLLLANLVPVHPVGDPARLVSRAERARAWAAVGAIAGAILAAIVIGGARLGGVDLLEALAPLSGGQAIGVVLVAAAVIGAALGALTRRTDGLPHDLAFRYGVRLDQGDTVLCVRAAPGNETRAAQELLGVHGAIFAHATRGTVEPRDVVPPDLSLAPSQN